MNKEIQVLEKPVWLKWLKELNKNNKIF
jgi:hypothetical protein